MQAEQAAVQHDQQTRRVRRAKQEAIETQDFERAAALRDQERELMEQAPAETVMQPEVLTEITRRLGIPRGDGAPPPPEPGA
jgi:excinuclease UvrABC nuclease subunit